MQGLRNSKYCLVVFYNTLASSLLALFLFVARFLHESDHGVGVGLKGHRCTIDLKKLNHVSLF